MARTALLLAVVVADTGSAWLSGTAGRDLAVTAALTAAVLLLAARLPFAAFPVAVLMALVTGGSAGLLAVTGYQAGRRAASRPHPGLVVAAAFAYPALLLLPTQRLATDPWPALARVGLLVALPLAAGVHFTRQAELERTRERLRIALDMHDSLGRWLSLVSVQAAALEVAPLPDDQRSVARDLAHAARTAVDELHAVVAALRAGPGLEGVDEVVAQFRRAGVAVAVERSGTARRVAADAGRAAFRVVQEGLTNATRHAPGSPVAVSLDWQPDALLVTVANPTRLPAAGPVDGPADGLPTGSGGTGLAGLAERVRSAGGLLLVHDEPGAFRLTAMLPLAPDRIGATA